MNNNYNVEFIEKALKQLPSNIFIKDTECRYIMCTHYWRHLDVDNDNWDIKGKTDLEIRKDKENAEYAYIQDKKIIETGIGTDYIIKVEQDGILEYLEIIKAPIFENEKVIGIVGLINDVTKKVLLEQQLETYASTDTLTGLFNRRYFDLWMERQNKDNIYPISILSADCNGLKRINDKYGHYLGDEFLRTTASVLKLGLPNNSIIFRMGGDEFLAILPNTNKKDAIKYVKKLEKLSKMYKIHGEEISVAYGVSEIKNYATDFTNFINEADEKMYEEKQKIYKKVR